MADSIVFRGCVVDGCGFSGEEPDAEFDGEHDDDGGDGQGDGGGEDAGKA